MQFSSFLFALFSISPRPFFSFFPCSYTPSPPTSIDAFCFCLLMLFFYIIILFLKVHGKPFHCVNPSVLQRNCTCIVCKENRPMARRWHWLGSSSCSLAVLQYNFIYHSSFPLTCVLDHLPIILHPLSHSLASLVSFTCIVLVKGIED